MAFFSEQKKLGHVEAGPPAESDFSCERGVFRRIVCIKAESRYTPINVPPNNTQAKNAIQLADTIGAFGACAARTDDE
jgi:hypothetical protein